MNIPLFKVFVADDVMPPLQQVLESGYIGQGPKVDEFERMLGDYLGSPYINTLNSGTSGLHIAMHMLKYDEAIRTERDEVLTTPLTCTATNWPILALGFKIRWVDVDPNTANMDMVDLRRKLSPRTRAIMVVHWGGYPCDLDEISSIQDQCEDLYGFRPPIIEDCAHAFGATYKDKMIGSHGNFCMFSFQAIKHITTGDGGMLVCPSDEYHRRAKLLRWYGLDRTSSADFRCEQNIQEWGYKFQMNDIAATIGIQNLKNVDWILGTHQANGHYYDDELNDISGVNLLECANDRESSYWVYTMRVERRDDFVRKMKENGIGVSRVHDRNDKHACVQAFRCALPGTDEICSNMICIPCGWWVREEEREYIMDTIKKGW